MKISDVAEENYHVCDTGLEQKTASYVNGGTRQSHARLVIRALSFTVFIVATILWIFVLAGALDIIKPVHENYTTPIYATILLGIFLYSVTRLSGLGALRKPRGTADLNDDHPGTAANYRQLWRQYLSNYFSNLCWAYKTITDIDDLTLERKIRFVLRSIFFSKASAAWYEYLRTSHLSLYPHTLNNLIQQAHRPFYDYRIAAYEKVLLLINHHESLLKLLGDKKALSLINKRKLEVCNIDGKHGEKYKIILSMEDRFIKEGGLSLSLLNNEETLISSTFTFNESITHKRLLIGCIQATANETAEKLRHATHELYGIQPRILLINILRILCGELGIGKIEAVSSSNHVYMSLRYKRKKKIVMTYDALWELMGGRKKDNGNYDIPVVIPHKSIESYLSKKRNEHRHRNELMENTKVQLSSFINSPNDKQNISSLKF